MGDGPRAQDWDALTSGWAIGCQGCAYYFWVARALRAARMAWRNPANELRRHAVRRASAKAALVARKYYAATMALAPGALRLFLAGVAWVMVQARRIGMRLLAVVPLVVRVVLIIFGWLVRSGRKVAAWGNKEAVDVRPRTRIL